MNLLCPNCQKPLTVPEQYAGQLMKCPLCNGTFGVPGLPQAPAPPPPPLADDVFKLAPEPPPPARNQAGPALAPVPEPAAETPAPPPTPPLAGYQHTASLTLRPEVLVWIPAAALSLVFVLLFCSWVRVYETGEEVWHSQSGWGTGFGHEWSLWGSFHILLLFPALALAVAVAVVPLLRIKLPPPVEQVWAWRSAILAAVIALPTLFLLAELAIGFGMEQVVKSAAEGPAPPKDAPKDLRTQLTKSPLARKVAQATLQRTVWLELAVLLHVVAVGAAGLVAWLDRRALDHPPPRFDVMW